MLKPTANYKMSKAGKIYLAQIVDPHKRGEIKRTIIQAELSAMIVPKREKRTDTRTNTTTAPEDLTS